MNGAKAVRTVAMTEAAAHGACALCTVLRHYQTQLVEVTGLRKATHLCNQHAWLLARSAPAALAAQIYAQVLDAQCKGEPRTDQVCAFCVELRREEDVRLNELVQRMKVLSFAQWMRRSGTLCLRHATRLSERLPEARPVVDEILVRTVEELKEDLKKCVANSAREQHNIGGGVLGRVAEYLVCQRGIPGEETPC
jgi:hypothetical protein